MDFLEEAWEGGQPGLCYRRAMPKTWKPLACLGCEHCQSVTMTSGIGTPEEQAVEQWEMEALITVKSRADRLT